jgi:hypothetical protein
VAQKHRSPLTTKGPAGNQLLSMRGLKTMHKTLVLLFFVLLPALSMNAVAQTTYKSDKIGLTYWDWEGQSPLTEIEGMNFFQFMKKRGYVDSFHKKQFNDALSTAEVDSAACTFSPVTRQTRDVGTNDYWTVSEWSVTRGTCESADGTPYQVYYAGRSWVKTKGILWPLYNRDIAFCVSYVGAATSSVPWYYSQSTVGGSYLSGEPPAGTKCDEPGAFELVEANKGRSGGGVSPAPVLPPQQQCSTTTQCNTLSDGTYACRDVKICN